MLDAFRPGESIVWDYLWQSTLFLFLGLAASVVLARRPARAHRLLLLAVLAALVTPILVQAARRSGWGLLTSEPKPDATSTITSVTAAPTPTIGDDSPLIAGAPFPSLAMARSGPMEAVPSVRVSGSRGVEIPENAAHPNHSAGDPNRFVPNAWRSVAFGAWLIAAGLAVARLVLGLVIGLSVVRRARPLDDATLVAAAALAATRLGVRQPPELRASARVACPAIWCWGWRPIILLADHDNAPTIPVDWLGIFCHELAHWVRRDHVSSLVAEILACLLPWHPLAWWAKHRLSQLSELACDDWALSTGLEATDYAETLLGLVPQRRGSLDLAAVSSRRGLAGRVRYVLEERRISPAVGRTWAALSAVVMVLAASALALAQTRPGVKAQSPKPEVNAGSASVSKPEPATNKESAMKHTIRGTVLGPDDKPVPGAEVFWVGYHMPKVTPSVMPKDDESRGSQRPAILARSRAEASGRYTLTGDFDAQEFMSHHVVVIGRGFGLQSHYLKKYGEIPDDSQVIEDEVTFRLVHEAIIRGRLLTPAGAPASGARVWLDRFSYQDERREGVGRMTTDDEIPPYWPRPRTTDADGRFTLERVPQGAYATLTFRHPDYAVDDITINTTGDDKVTPISRTFELTPVKPTFTHTLEPARPVQGRVTDKATGKPLAGILVEMTPMRRQGGNPFHTRTDSDGRYRVSGHQADTYITTVYPPGSSGYLASSDRQQGWPAGAKVLEKNFALEQGRILRGRVFDADTRKPIADAAVIYQPRPGNPNSRNRSTDVANPVLTDAGGWFAVSGLPGEGDLLLEVSWGYIRTKFPQGKSERWALYPHGYASVDVPAKGEAAPVEITVRKGVTFTARVVGPDGKPVTRFAAFCPELSGKAIYRGHHTMNYPDDRFIFRGADPSRTYRVIFASARHQAAAVVEIKPDSNAPQPVEIRLQPAARVHGKVVNPSGTPMSEGQVYPMIALDQKTENLSRTEILSQEFYSNLLEGSARPRYYDKPGPNGEFTHDALVPGMPFYIVAESGGREAFHYVPPLKPDEDRDLGTITLKEEQP